MIVTSYHISYHIILYQSSQRVAQKANNSGVCCLLSSVTRTC